MLHLEEALVDERLALPRVNVLPDQRIGQQFKHFARRNGNIVPALVLERVGQRVLHYVILDPLLVVFLVVIVLCTGKTLHREETLIVTVIVLLILILIYLILLIDSRRFDRSLGCLAHIAVVN